MADKKRNWAFLIYDDSAPKDWEQILTDTGLAAAVSPHHDKDVEYTGEIKKPHWHIIVCYPGPTTYSNVKKLAQDKLHGTIPIALESVKGMYRYHFHLDHPDKYQYPQSQEKFFGGFDVSAYNDRTKAEIFRGIVEITRIIHSKALSEYADLIDYLFLKMENEEEGGKYEFLFDVASSHTVFFRGYMISRKKRSEAVQNDGRI